MTDTSTTSHVASAISGGLTGAVAGGITSILVEICMSKYRRRQQFKRDLQDGIDDFYASVSAYWTASGRNQALETQIISQHPEIRKELRKAALKSGWVHYVPAFIDGFIDLSLFGFFLYEGSILLAFVALGGLLYSQMLYSLKKEVDEAKKS